MKKSVSNKYFVLTLVFLVLIGLQLNCSFLSALNPPNDADSPPQDSQPVQENNPAPSSSNDPNNTENADAPEYLDCPAPGETLYLGFDHTLTMNYEEASLTHILHAGMLNLNVQSGSDQEEAAISSIAPISIPYEMQGVMGDCSLDMQGTMMASASGYCEDGTVYLIITEDWQPASGQMICPDGAMPFQVPAAGPMIHEGADGNGEVFYLVTGSEGYTSMRPFQEGDGYHTWTLYTTQVDLVPLVPEE